MTQPCTPQPMAEDDSPLRVESVLTMAESEERLLWIGNSLTFEHRLPRLVTRLAEASCPQPPMGTRMVVRGGGNLGWHRAQGHAQAALDEGIWRRVIIQDHSRRPADEPQASYDDLCHWGAAARAVGAEPLLYCTWAADHHPALGDTLMATYRRAAHSLGCAWAPVGPAFAAAAVQLPQIALLREDRLHPSMAGSYLAGCVWLTLLRGPQQDLPAEVEDCQAILAQLQPADAQALNQLAQRVVAQYCPTSLAAPAGSSH